MDRVVTCRKQLRAPEMTLALFVMPFSARRGHWICPTTFTFVSSNESSPLQLHWQCALVFAQCVFIFSSLHAFAYEVIRCSCS